MQNVNKRMCAFSMKKIGIYGIGGLYNYGCEAIVRGTVTNIRKIDSNFEITYYSKNYEYDKNQIKDLNINIVNIESKNNIFKRIINKLIEILKLPIFMFVNKEYKEVIENSDIIMSVGGDIYSIPQYKRSKKTYQYVNKMVEFGELAKKQGKKIIIYGASIGPFGEYAKAKDYFISHLKKVDLIICREQYSIDYLNENGVNDNVEFLPDPAYLVEYKIDEYKQKKYIGINLSALSIYEIYGSLEDGVIDKVCKLLKFASEKLNSPLMLIPHVYSPYDRLDNDYDFLKRIYNKLPHEVQKDVKLVKPISFIDVKNYLIECKIVVAARMHCAVNAIIESIPTLFLSYSIKSKGMAEFIYNDLHWFLPLNEMENNLLELIKELDANNERVQNQLIERNNEIKKYFNINNEAYNRLRKVLLEK